MSSQFVIRKGLIVSEGGAQVTGSLSLTGSITANRFIGDGSQLSGVVPPTYTRKHDYSGSYSYCGKALSGSSESSNVWDITRITILSDGNTTKASASNVSWTGRYSHNYI